MSQVTVKRIDQMDAAFGGAMVRARAELGVTSFGMQVENLPPHWPDYPEHDESASGQEEVYIALRGSAMLTAGGAEYTLEPGVMARVAPGVSRKLVPGDDGLQLLVIGGVPGTFKAAPWSEVGAAEPGE